MRRERPEENSVVDNIIFSVMAGIFSLIASIAIVALGFYSKILAIPLILIFGLDGSNNIPEQYFGPIYYGMIFLYLVLFGLPVYILLSLLKKEMKT